MKFGAAVLCRNEWRFMPAVLGQLRKVCDRVVVLRGEKSLSGAPVELLPIPKIEPNVTDMIVTGTWTSEHETRNAGMEILADCDYVFTIDSDEIFSTESLNFLKESCTNYKYRALACRMWTYWKTSEYRIDPPEQLTPTVVAHRSVRFSHLRVIEGSRALIDRNLMHHLSYVRTDEEVLEKLQCFGHAHEILPGWYDRVWRGWDTNKSMEDLHPTHPAAYKRAVKISSANLSKILTEFNIS